MHSEILAVPGRRWVVLEELLEGYSFLELLSSDCQGINGNTFYCSILQYNRNRYTFKAKVGQLLEL